MQRLLELVAAADRALSDLEVRLSKEPNPALRLGTVTELVVSAAARYLDTVDGIPTQTLPDALRAARHTGLLAADEADLLLALLTSDGTPAAAPREAVRVLRLLLERVRDTAKKAVEPTEP